MSTEHAGLTAHLMRPLRGWVPSAPSFTILQRALPTAISFLPCFGKLIFHTSHRRSLRNFQFSGEFFHFLFVLPSLCVCVCVCVCVALFSE